MKKLVATTFALVIAAGVAVGVAEELQSGLPCGDKVPAFNVKDVTGPNKGTSLCYRCQYGARPVVTIFTRTMDDNVQSLIKQVDGLVGKNGEKQMKAFVVVLTDKPEEQEKSLPEVAKKHNIKSVPLTVFDSPAGPPNYKIAKDAEVTVMMWNKSEVKANQAFAKGKFDKKAVEGVVADTAKILN